MRIVPRYSPTTAWGRVLFLAVLALGPSGSALASASRRAAIRYLSPVPGARYVAPGAGLIVRLERAPTLSARELQRGIEVIGSSSGTHPGVARLARDCRTLLFRPDHAFDWGEQVSVRLDRALLAAGGGASDDSSYAFTIASGPPPAYTPREEWESELPPSALVQAGPRAARAALEDLPPDFPSITSTVHLQPAPGRIYLASLSFIGAAMPYLLVLDNHASPYFYRAMTAPCFDFKLQPNGLITYFDQSTEKYYAMDPSYAVVDSFACGNGYPTDVHELRLEPNGHAFLMSYDPEIVDMSTIVNGGNPTATVIGLVVQELDENKDVVFEWRSWDHYEITDATHENLTAAQIDYVHGNAIEIDADSTLMVSCRHMDEITKISRETGDIVWRWGGKHNEFAFIGDTLQFSHQHAVRRLPSGTVTVMDNGNFHVPQYSRAVEYQLDEVNKTAQAIWQFRNTPDTFAGAMGYVQRLDDGNTLIAWGTGVPSLTEVRPDGQKTVEMTLPAGVYSYRGFRFPGAMTTAVAADEVARTLRLSMPTPNPARGRAALTLTLSEPAMVSLAVYDLSGRRVREALSGARLPAGQNPLAVDLSDQAPGLYFLRVRAGNASATRKLLLAR